MPSLDKNGTSVAHVDTVLLGRKDTAAAEVVDNLLLSIFGQGGAAIMTERNNVVNVFFIGIK